MLQGHVDVSLLISDEDPACFRVFDLVFSN